MAKKLNINKDAYVSTTGVTLEQIANSLTGIVVIEKGSNGNGSWIKCGNGILIQYGKITGVTMGKASGTSSTITFPKPYIDSNYNIQTQMLGVPSYWSWATHTIYDGSKTTTGFTVRWWNNSGDSIIDSVGLYWYTIGLWTNETQPSYTPPTANQMQELINLLEDLPIGYTITTDANGWTVIDNPVSPYIEYFKRGTKQITLNTGISWLSFKLSDLPVGVTNAKVAHLSGNIESWDGALNTGVNLRSNQVQGIAQWLYGGNGWNQNHTWTAHIIVFR